MGFINIKGDFGVETIDEFKGFQEGKTLIKEYRISDKYNYYYISQKSTNEWRNR